MIVTLIGSGSRGFNSHIGSVCYSDMSMISLAVNSHSVVII